MKPLSPVDAIGPAFSRMRSILMPPGAAPDQPGPFRFWFFLKIVVVAALTNPSFIFGISIASLEGVAFFMTGLGASLRGLHRQPIETGPSEFAGVMVVFIAGAALVAIAMWLLLTWLWCRLRFTLFDLVVYGRGRVGRAWSPYGRPAWRFLGLVILVSLAFLLLASVTIGPMVLHLFVALRGMTPQEINSDPFLMMSHIFPMYGIIFAIAILAGLAGAVMTDFLLPPMAIEDAPLESAFGRFFHLLGSRFGSVAIYLLLRFALQLGLSWIGGIVIVIVLIAAGGGGVAGGFVLYRSLWHLGGGPAVLFILYCVVAGLALIALYFLTMMVLYGLVMLFLQSFAVYFFGSHYPELGDRLEPGPRAPAPWPGPPTPAPPVAPPVPELPPIW
ncbi:MAG TPA: hypothetical protein VMD25_08215 [Acidobacteriaceae bacterium]|nr:hypothetical protein [Acidobacteriaceae bacterium]